jgi:hypothetical protein
MNLNSIRLSIESSKMKPHIQLNSILGPNIIQSQNSTKKKGVRMLTITSPKVGIKTLLKVFVFVLKNCSKVSKLK